MLFRSTTFIVFIVVLVGGVLSTEHSVSDNDAKVISKLSQDCRQNANDEACIEAKILEGLGKGDHVDLAPGVEIVSAPSGGQQPRSFVAEEDAAAEEPEPTAYLLERTADYLRGHALHIHLGRALEGWQEAVPVTPRTGGNTFLTGFGLGFLAFALKKLLLPVFIGAQIVKSVLLAMFLPTILSGIGKFLGKSGASVFSASSGPSTDDFDFKDNYDPSSYDTAASTNTATFTYPQSPQNRYETAQDVAYTSYDPKPLTGQHNLYSLYKNPAVYRRPTGAPLHASIRPNAPDFKKFNQISPSSLKLKDFDPFYSPILSRIDSIFKQLGYDQLDESCREKLVCKMYKSPAKYSPYSNLMSAQLSRELRDLQKPTLNSPDILRYFRYMKAAKDGQDMSDCEAIYAKCVARDPLSSNSGAKSTEDGLLGGSPPMLKTYHDINKLVQARRLAKGFNVTSTESSEDTTTTDATTTEISSDDETTTITSSA